MSERARRENEVKDEMGSPSGRCRTARNGLDTGFEGIEDHPGVRESVKLLGMMYRK